MEQIDKKVKTSKKLEGVNNSINVLCISRSDFLIFDIVLIDCYEFLHAIVLELRSQ